MKTYKNHLNTENIRLYDRYLRNRRSDTGKTKKKIKYLMYMEKYIDGKPLKKICMNDINCFNEYLDNLTYKDKPIAESTKSGAVNTIGKFFTWLSNIKGYKTVKTCEIIEYFKLIRKEKKALSGENAVKKYPSLEEARKIVANVPTNNILGRRIQTLVLPVSHRV